MHHIHVVKSFLEINWKLFFDILVSTITSVALLIGAVVAVIGLNTWKKQLKGNADYELARRVLRSTYKLRDAIKYVRNPFISVEEQASAAKEVGSEKVGGSQAIFDVYSVRWQKINTATSDLEAEGIEAEVLWGKPAVEVQKDFWDCVRKLYINLNYHLKARKDPEIYGRLARDSRDIIYATDPANENDSFSLEIKAAVSKIEEFLKPHLK